MKTSLFYVIILLSAHFVQGGNINVEPPIKVSIVLPERIYAAQKHIYIMLKITNTTSETISIRNPEHWGNAYPYMKDKNGVDTPCMIKVRLNPKVFNDIIQIKGGETLIKTFSFTLDEIYSLERCPNGYYDIYFELCPDGKRSIKSDVFTFYIYQLRNKPSNYPLYYYDSQERPPSPSAQRKDTLQEYSTGGFYYKRTKTTY